MYLKVQIPSKMQNLIDNAEISINPYEEGARSRLQARSLVVFPGAAVIEKGSRWEAVQRAGRLLKQQGGPLPSCSRRAEGTTKYLATLLGRSRTQKHTEKDLPGAGVHPTALNMILGEK